VNGFEHNGVVPSRRDAGGPPAGLVVTPGASAGRDHSGLVAIDDAATRRGIVTERVEFPGQAAGRRRPDSPAICIETVRAAATALATRLSVPLGRIAVGGRSFGGRMCSLAVADGLEAAALVLVSYPLHPPGRPDRLRTEHFTGIAVPCLFVSGRRDAFATPDELESETATIAGAVTLAFVDGDHSLRKGETDAAEIVASWLAGLP
jgi:predicted alpha/beta-hydrolase family hydrolase